jgi:carbamate kinase
MSKKILKIVIALGGNALQIGNGVSPKDQLAACLNTAKNVVELVKQGHQIAIVHGNGPQVGEVVAISELAHKYDNNHAVLPFDVCSSYTQGYIGYHLQNAIRYELAKNSINKEVVSIITQVEIDKNDKAFSNPTKPIGSFYTKEQADELTATANHIMKEDAGRGYRRVIASPKPLDIIEKDVIKNLYKAGVITICCGGGGIPVFRDKDQLIGVEAVIDKDFTAAKLSEIISADMLLILTAVDQVAINFNKSNQQYLTNMSVAEAKQYIAEGQFAPGSMLPKIEASLKFIESNNDGKILITSLENAAKAIIGGSGTLIEK